MAAAAFGFPATVMADLPTAEDFQILYYTVDYVDGEPRRGRLMTADDHARFVNRARCECGHEIWARVVLGPGDYPNVPIRTFVGHRCDDAQATFNPQVRPCALLRQDHPQGYREGVDLLFHPIWLARGVEDVQSVDDAVAFGGCGSGRGEGGLWICMEFNGQLDCQPEEFIVQGDRAENLPDGGGTRYDFEPPLLMATDARVERAGDEVRVEWELEGPDPDIGFRVLCADARGEPVGDAGFEPPTLTELPLGTIYYTDGNLCDEQPFSHVEMSEPSEGVSPTGIASLDWAYVCSGHLPFDSTRVSIRDDGLAQQFLLVAYDPAGNPTVASELLTLDSLADPLGDGELGELSGRGCDCRTNPTPAKLTWLAMLCAVVLRRRRSYPVAAA